MKKIKQINNIVIKQDTTEKINYFGEVRNNPHYGLYSCWHGSVCLADKLTLNQAIEYCKETTDYVKR